MWIVRAVRTSDLDSLCNLVALATQGLTSLQLDRDQLLDRVEQSVFAFSRRGMSPRGEPFVLVMAEPESGEIVGTSTVYAKTGGYQPFYLYQRIVSQHRSEQLGVGQTRERLELQRTHDGPTEIGSLFLRQRCRGEGRGRWLSLARFALIAGMRHRFADRVIAEMRGLTLPDGTVPFWDAVTSRFVPVDFATADTLSTVSKQFIEEMMPQHPIYSDLLPADVRAAIGQVHPETKPALAMLQKEGFEKTDQVDIFDGGPVVSCETDKIKAVERTRSLTVTRVVDKLPAGSGQVILVSSKEGFTSIRTSVAIQGAEIQITASDAQVLDLAIGETCWILPEMTRQP